MDIDFRIFLYSRSKTEFNPLENKGSIDRGSVSCFNVLCTKLLVTISDAGFTQTDGKQLSNSVVISSFVKDGLVFNVHYAVSANPASFKEDNLEFGCYPDREYQDWFLHSIAVNGCTFEDSDKAIDHVIELMQGQLIYRLGQNYKST